MQINLKQVEIIQALKSYISQKGISLSGKTVDCTFTAGRKDSGISVEISIEDQEIPGYTDGSPEEVEVAAPAPVTKPKAVPKSAAEYIAPDVFATSIEVVSNEPTEPKPAKPSLFGVVS